MTPAGAEAVTQCSNHDNQWCCDGDRIHIDCCQEQPKRPFFALQDPVAYGTIGGKTGSSAPNLATITGKGTGSGDDSSSSTAASNSASATQDSSSGNSASSTAASSTAASTLVTSLSTTVSSGSAGPTTIVTTIIQSAASSSATASPASTSKKSSNVGLIVGCAVGVPLALALIGILFWLFRKRAHQKHTAPPYTSSTDAFTPTPATPEFAGGAKLHKPNSATKYAATANPGVPELGGGQGVGPERPVSMIPGKAEMDSGGGFAPGTVPLAPHLVGVGGGNGAAHGHTPQSSWGSAPPGYSPAQSQGPLAPTRNSDPMAGQYQAYRPPGMNNVPEMAELPSVRTPPEVAELGNPSPPVAGARAEYPGMAEAGARR
ncbi:hypothetical protein SLS60_000370 [Paraconiothyrium brasiliense]|uniref:Uncharacterized protein n=1 Tax=Paraconiothyrium brasiliense TaxID=300254 RepID=A0ABR3S7H6_9PLEO